MGIIYLCNVKMRRERYANVLVYLNIHIMFYKFLNIHLCFGFIKKKFILHFFLERKLGGFELF